jgi:hypothetical protein
LFNVDFDTQIVSVDMFVCIGHVLYGDEYTKYDRWQPVSTAARQQRQEDSGSEGRKQSFEGKLRKLEIEKTALMAERICLACTWKRSWFGFLNWRVA